MSLLYAILQKNAFAKGKNMNFKILLFDLDGTLLRSDKTVSDNTLSVISQCRKSGLIIGISTSRSDKNCVQFIKKIMPDIIISSGGALVKYRDKLVFRSEFSVDETNTIIREIRNICGNDCEITVDTFNNHYWNYKIDPKCIDQSWGKSIYNDFQSFSSSSLKICAEIIDEDNYKILKEKLCYCDSFRFSDGFWYKFTKKTATKENAIIHLCDYLGIRTEEIIAFGDDYADIGMLQLCGIGVAMGNADETVKNAADVVINSSDEDGVAEYLKKKLLS